MPLQSEVVRSASPRPEILPAGDLRRYRRMPVEVPGRFMRADRNEYECQLHEISVGSGGVTTPGSVQLGERVVAYFDHLGGLDGSVMRVFDGGFDFQFKVSEHKREKLASQIMWLVNREMFPDFTRAHERIGTAGRKTTIKFEDGVIVDVDLLDLSPGGASIGTAARPAIGAECAVGRIPAIVRRHHDKGLGVQFLDVQTDDALRQVFP